MSNKSNKFDAVVIGAGAGGLCAAARLAHNGYRVLVVEALEAIGGRASTRTVDGFLCNTGALVIELDGAVADTYRDLGLELKLYEPHRSSTVLRVGGRDVNITEGPAGWVRNIAPLILRSITNLRPSLRPLPGQSLKVWLNKFTRRPWVHGLMNNVVGAMFAASTEDVPADVILHYFTKGTSFKKIGMPVGGTIEVWKPLVEVIKKSGGEVWLGSKANRLNFSEDGLVSGVLVEKGGDLIEVSTSLLVSNIGPLATVDLVDVGDLPEGYAQGVREASDPAAIITVHFASPRPLASFPCLAIFSQSRRMVYAANFSAPELQRAPAGWHLYCGASVPRPARGEFDVELEKRLLLEDIREQFPGFDQSMVVAIDVTAHEWPAQRAITGYDLPPTTPIKNLWNVGDGVKPWGGAGTAACAETAKLIVGEICRRFPRSVQ